MVAAGFEVRAVSEEELPAFIALGLLAFHERLPDGEERRRAERFMRSARRFGAYDGDELIGVAGALDMELSVPGGALPCAGLTWVAVAPTHRRRGIARKLIAFAESRFTEYGGTRADAMVLDTNTEAHAAWRNAGYSPQPNWSRWVKPL